MSLTDVLLLLVVIVLAYIAVSLKLIGAAVERVAGKTHYQQQTPFRPSVRAPKAPQVEHAARTIKTNNLIDITDLSEEQALEALEKMGTE